MSFVWRNGEVPYYPCKVKFKFTNKFFLKKIDLRIKRFYFIFICFIFIKNIKKIKIYIFVLFKTNKKHSTRILHQKTK
jgi:hypothetical protein